MVVRISISVAKSRLNFGLEFLTNVLTSIIFALVLASFWSIVNYKFSIEYFLVMAALGYFSIGEWGLGSLTDDVRSGNIINVIRKPVNTVSYYFFEAFGSFISSFPTAVILLTILLIFSKNFLGVLLILLDSILVALLSFTFYFTMAPLIFRTESRWGIFAILNRLINAIFAGYLIPMDVVKKIMPIADILPFKYLGGEVFKLYLVENVGEVILMQIFWIIVFYLISEFLIRREIRRIVAYGG